MAKLIKKIKRFYTGGIQVINDIKTHNSIFTEKDEGLRTDSLNIHNSANSTKWSYQRRKASQKFNEIDLSSAEAVARFQRNNNLKEDGLLGEETLKKLNEIYNKNIGFDQIRYINSVSNSTSKNVKTNNKSTIQRKEAIAPEFTVTAISKKNSTKNSNEKSDPNRAGSYQEALQIIAKNNNDSETNIDKLAQKYGEQAKNWKGTKSYNDYWSSKRKKNTEDVAQASFDIVTLPLRFGAGLVAGGTDLAINEGMQLLTGKTLPQHLISLSGESSEIGKLIEGVNFAYNLIKRPNKAFNTTIKKVSERSKLTSTKKYSDKSFNPSSKTHNRANITNINKTDNPKFRENIINRIKTKGGYKIDNPEEFFQTKGLNGKEVWYVPPKGQVTRTNSGTYYYYKKGGLIPRCSTSKQ